VEIGGRKVGAAHTPLFWPDIDVYFRRDQDIAIELVDKIADAGIGFLKGAVLHRMDLCLETDREMQYFDHKKQQMVSEPYHTIMQRMAVPLPMLSRILVHAKNRGLSLILSIYDLEGLEFALDQGAVALKIPSSNITHKSLIQAVAASGLPMVMDTGRSKMSEIATAVEWAEAAKETSNLILQHSPPGPPAPPDRFHMRILQHLKQIHDCPVSLSDHHPGADMIPVAIALGACVIEKGLVANKDTPDIDVAHALPIEQLPDALKIMNNAWDSLGSFIRPDNQVPPVSLDRMGCVAAKSISANSVIGAADIGFAFPAMGLGAEQVDQVIGAKATCDIAMGQPIVSQNTVLK